MSRRTMAFIFCAVFLCPGVISMIRYSEKLFQASEHVRLVHVLGLSASGVTCGAALVGVILALTGRLRPTGDGKPSQTQSPPLRDPLREAP